ncbi:MAG: hypothetical protein A4E63_02765 [Syntrophorhabdus sp. PtaU1.Bin050]|nr:MAG: hypothetical protein A4E63_02765 [Syntrophorhabdus sp. PtaU1.Bin050]
MNHDGVEDLVLESLGSDIPTLNKVKASMLRETCIWCLTKCEHSNGVQIKCDIFTAPVTHTIKWEDDVDLDGLLRAYNDDDAVPFGAEALALLLIRKHTPFTAIQRAAKPSGIDYWLGYKSKNPYSLFSMKDARLEISGILVESGSNTIKSRIKQKLKQTEASDHVFPVFISVIEFGNPKAETVRKDAIS